MSLRESFRSAWRLQFPSESPPELECFHSAESQTGNKTYGTYPLAKDKSQIDREAVERSLRKCNENIVKYEVLLQKEKFVTEFLWRVLHNVENQEPTRARSSRHGPVSSKTMPSGQSGVSQVSLARSLTTDGVVRQVESVSSPDALDNVIPVPGAYSETTSPTSAGDTYCNMSEWSDASQISVSGYSTSSSMTSGNWSPFNREYVRNHLLDSHDSMYNSVQSGDSENVGSSLSVSEQPHSSSVVVMTSSTKPQTRPKPVPAPRASRQKTPGDGTPVSAERESWLRSRSSENLKEERDGSPDLGHRFSSARHRPQPKLPEVSLIVNLHDKVVTASSRDVVVGGVGKAVQETAVDDEGEMYCSATDLYEEAAPVHREFIEEEEVSTDDEEPLYSNLQQLKEQTMAIAKTWYASRDEIKSAQTQGSSTRADSRLNADTPQGLIATTPFTPTSLTTHSTDSTAAKLLSAESVRSTSSEHLFDGDVPFGWRKRRSLLRALTSVDSQSELDEVELNCSMYPDDEILHMRKFVVKSIVDSEKGYLGILDILMQYMQTFRNCLGTPQAVISAADIDVIFNKIPELHKAHKFFLRDLEQKVENWSTNQQISDPFRVLATEESRLAPDYLKNYQKALDTIRRCRVESELFASLSVAMKVPHMKENPNLEELVHKPVVRFQRNTLVLHDLIKYTPATHADYDPLHIVLRLAQDFLENFENSSNKDSAENHRYLAKQGVIVEKVGNIRKIRHIFLFNDVLICAKPKFPVKQKAGFEPKWYVPLMDLALNDMANVEEEKQLADNQQQEIEVLQKRVATLQNELKAEMRLVRGVGGEAQRQWSFHNRSRNIDKIKKKLIEEQAAMIKASPRLLLRVFNRRYNREYTLLMASDYERSNWRSTIAGLLSRVSSSLTLSSADLQNLLNNQKLPKIGTLESLIDIQDIALDEEHLFGCLNITIYKLQGLKQAAEVYCTVEVDSFGHFFMKAKTNKTIASTEPTWNQDFEIDLEGAQTIRILCYKMGKEVGSLIGTCALELSRAWLRGDFTEKSISLNEEISVVISLGYVSRQQTLKRTPTCNKSGLFGARIRQVTKREGTSVPKIVTGCVQEVESRGLEEVGIYRISGASGEIQKLKQSFEKNISSGCQLLKSADINVVTGLLKLYFRELPEALFTDKLYSNLINGMGLKDPDAKEKYIISVLQTLPEPNKSTVVYLMDHLIRVAAPTNGNKMTLQNLSTVFGPTLLRPAVSSSEALSMEELFSAGTREAMTQTTMLLYFLTLRGKGAMF